MSTSASEEVLPLALAQQKRFWSKATRSSGCWLWRAARDKDGYGKFVLMRPADGGKRHIFVRAHRLAYVMSRRRMPKGVVMHTCDTPACVNPSHLRAGTVKKNRADCVAKGRARTRVLERKVLTVADARAIRAARAKGATRRVLAERYGVTAAHITNIVAGRKWRNQ